MTAKTDERDGVDLYIAVHKEIERLTLVVATREAANSRLLSELIDLLTEVKALRAALARHKN